MSPPFTSQLSPFVGREQAVADVLARLDADRLLALTGPVGVGKSRLAKEVLARLRAKKKPPIVRFVDARGAAGLAEVLARVGDALSTPAPRDATQDWWVEAIAGALCVAGDLVLVLDNVEAVAGEVEDALFAWLAAAPEARLLLTTRHRLARHDMPRFAVPPLDDESALALLLELSEQARGSALSDDERASAGQVVARLDRLPLAIEFAAARAEVLPLTEIAARAHDGAGVLADGPAGAGRSLSAALAGAWEMLDDTERATLLQLSVFAHDLTLAHAEAVVDVPPDRHVLDVLHALARKSLLKVDPSKESTRFSLLESVRAFATARLSAAERSALLRRLAAFLLERYGDDERPPESPRVEDDLSAIFDDARTDDAALAARVGLLMLRSRTLYSSAHQVRALSDEVREVAAASGERDLIVRAAESHALALLDVGRSAEAQVEIESVLDSGVTAEQEVRLLSPLGYALVGQGRFDDARAASARSLRTAAGMSALAQAHAHNLATIVAGQAGVWADALDHALEATRLFREAHDEHQLRTAQTNAGRCYVEIGESERGERPIEEALLRARQSDERLRLPYYLGNAALLRLEQARYDEALALAEEASRGADDYAADTLASLRHGERGVALALMGRLSDARLAFLRATEPVRGRDAARTQALFGAWRAAVEARIGGSFRVDRHLEAALSASADVKRVDLAPALRALQSAVDPSDRAAAEVVLDEASSAPSLHARLAGRWLRDVLEGRPPARERSSGALLRLLDGGHRFEIDGLDHDVSQRSRLRLALLALVDAHAKAPGEPLETHELFEAGWPGQRIQHEAMRNRVYNAVATLRKHGLGNVLLSLDGGYLLDPRLRVERA